MSTLKAGNIQPQSDSDPLVFSTNATERLRIASGGNVGIGTSNSTSYLQITAPTREATAGGLTGSLAKCGLVLESTLNGSGSPQYGPGLWWKSTSGALANTAPLAGVFVGGRGLGTCINFATSTAYAEGINKIGMTITDGKVGIGTTGPSVALDVVGSAAVNGELTVTGGATFSGKITTASTTSSDSSTTVATKGYVDGICIGVGQTWKNVLASRSSGVTYTNTTGRPIMVIVGAGDTSNQSPTLTVVVDGITIISGVYDAATGGGNISVSFIVPAGSTYSATITVTTISHWVELR